MNSKLLLTLTTLILLISCTKDKKVEYYPKDLICKQCTIQFDRHTLGSGRQLPINPTTDSINGAEVSVAGKIKDINPKWVVISTHKNGRDLLYIPMKSILLIERHKK